MLERRGGVGDDVGSGHCRAACDETGSIVQFVEGGPRRVAEACLGAVHGPASAEGLVESLRASTAQAIEVHVEAARAHDAILGVADRVRADLIVIGNQGLVRRGRLTSEVPALVLRGARCSVLTVDAATT